MEKEIYPDILSRAIANDKTQEVRGRILTDHGWVTNADFALLVERRLPAYLNTQIHVKTSDNGESWVFYPDGSKSLLNDQAGNPVK